jgi:nucleoside 2-deoxyribosyltransferase
MSPLATDARSQETFGHASPVASTRPRQVYLAGPFTQHLAPLDASAASPSGGGVSQGNGLISPESTWRRTLLATTAALERLGWLVFLPHRDVSAWGERHITPGVVASECLEAVVSSDLLVAVMGESFGTHVEVGAAIAWGIPVIMVRDGASAESFFASAVAESPWVATLSVPALSDLPQVVATSSFDRALGEARQLARLGDSSRSAVR